MIQWRKQEKLTSKERVLRTFEYKETDRIPIDYSANPGIDARLIEHYKLHPEDHEGLKEILGVDFARVDPVYKGSRLHQEIPGMRVDPQFGICTRWVEHNSGGYWDYCNFPLKNVTEEAAAAWPLPSPGDYDYGHIKDSCERYSQYAVQCGGNDTGCVINSTGFLTGMEDILIGLAVDDPGIFLLVERLTNLKLEILRRTIEAGKGGFDYVKLGEDLGTQNAPLISRELYRKSIRPIHKKFIDLAANYDLPVMVHTCGSSSWVYDDFIEMGVKAVDTLQPEATDMSPAYLKDRFGGKLMFHGCISTAGPISYGTVDEVAADVKETLSIMMPGGGYCLAPTHRLQDNSPVENVVALYELARTLGWY